MRSRTTRSVTCHATVRLERVSVTSSSRCVLFEDNFIGAAFSDVWNREGERAAALFGQELGEGFGRKLGARDAERFSERLVYENRAILRVKEPDPLTQAFYESALQRFAVLQRLLALFPGCNLAA